MLSKSCKYALKAILYLTQQSVESKRIDSKEIAEKLEIPYHFIAKILQKLSKDSIVSSQKGPSGGFFLTESNLNHSLADVVRSIDGEGIFVNCILGLKLCSENRPCPLHHQYAGCKRELKKTLQSTNLSEFKAKLDSGLFFLTNLPDE